MPRPKISVILADDHPVVRDGLANMVNQQPDMQTVAEAGDGDEAIIQYENHNPDVMVLDLRMPKRDGGVVEYVLGAPKARLLIMTTYDGDEDIFRSLSQGAGVTSSGRAASGNPVGDSRSRSDFRIPRHRLPPALQRMAKPSLTQLELMYCNNWHRVAVTKHCPP
jgi:two-component system NarL family response regulator